MKQFILALCSFFCLTQLQAQVVGTVTDTDGEALPFVSIYVENTYRGTTTNGDGEYELNSTDDFSAQQEINIVFQFLGYTTEIRTITLTEEPITLDVILAEESTSLDEVVIESGVNPAHRIIRAAIANRKKHLENTSSFTADFYSRGLWMLKNAPEKILGQELGDFGGGLDSTRTGIIYLSETVSKIAYQRPSDFSEVITASKVSGDDRGFSFNTAVDANFSFYENTISLNNEIVSPIASNAFSYYDYTLEGTFYEDTKLINKVVVTPKRPKDAVFLGIIYIVEDDWDLYGVNLETNGQSIQVPFIEKLNFKQTFSYDKESKQYIKNLQIIDFTFAMFGINGDGRFTAQYSNYDLNPTFSKKSFSNEVLSFAKEANKKDSLYWDRIRPVPLTKEEHTDYTFKDSVQVIRKSKTYLDSVDQSRNRFKLIDPVMGYTNTDTYNRKRLSYTGLLSDSNFNTVQGFIIGGELGYSSWSDEDFTKSIYAFAKANYSFSEDRVRYALGIRRRFNRTNRAYFSIEGGLETLAYNPTDISYRANSFISLLTEKNYLKIYERAFVEANYSQEVFNGVHVYTRGSYEDRRPLFNTTDQVWLPSDDLEYRSNNPRDITNYDTAAIVQHSIYKGQITAQIKVAQKYYSYPSGKFRIDDDRYPTLALTYEKGLGGSEDRLNYDQVRLLLQQEFNTANKGRTSYTFKAGSFLNTGAGISFVDYQHFNSNESFLASDGVYNNRFNVLPFYSRSTNTSYIEAHAEHNFKGWILGKIPGVQQLNFNLIAGAHALTTNDGKPYYEWSVGVSNIGWGKIRPLRIDYIKSFGPAGGQDGFIFGLAILRQLE